MKFFQKIKEYFVGVWEELKLVDWPDKEEVLNTTLAVLVFILIIAIFLGGIDLLISFLLKILMG